MTALALRDDQTHWETDQLAVLRANGIDEDVSEAELMAFLHECQRRKLDPFSKQIYLIGRKDKSKGRKVYRSQTSIDGFRLIARRAADHSGIDYSYDDTAWYDAEGGRHEIWLAESPPSGAKVVVIRNGQRFDAVARYGAYVQTDWDGNPLKQWRTMPDVMIAKCAEALALRKAFPEDLGGIYTDEEMAQADNPQRVTATAEIIRDEPADAWPGYEVAKKEARSLTTEAAGGALWRAAAAAAKAGDCTPGQATHVQNLIQQRIDFLKAAATPVDVEDLGRQAAAAADPTRPAAPAATSTDTGSSTAPAANGHSDAPEDEPGSASPDQLTALHITFGGLGFSSGDDDKKRKLKLAETITGRDLGGTSKNLSYTEARKLTDTLDGFGGDQGKLIAHMATLEQDGDSDA